METDTDREQDPQGDTENREHEEGHEGDTEVGHDVQAAESDQNNALITQAHQYTINNLVNLKTELIQHHEQIKSVHFKDYDNLEGLKASVGKAVSELEACQTRTGELTAALAGIRGCLLEVKSTVEKKISAEALVSWLSGDPANQNDNDKVAEEKATLSVASSTRVLIARANAEVASAHELVSRTEAEAKEAEEAAQKATEDAEIAAKLAEEARIAAEEKAKVEAEAKARAERERKKKEEEERKKAEEEERRRAEQTRLYGTPEEIERRRLEAERKNPKNWPRFVYSIDPGDYDPGVGCVVRAMEGSLRRDDLVVTRVEQLSGVLTLDEHEELVSSIVSIAKSDPETHLKPEEPFAIAFPHCASRNPAREQVVKILQTNGRWKELETHEPVIDDMKEFKFAEVRLDSFGSFVVVTRFKRDHLHLTRKGGKVFSSVDSRICMSFPTGAIRNNINFTMEVQPVELAMVSDLKQRHLEESQDLLASSPLVRLQVPLRKFNKAVTVILPLPPNPYKAKRPGTAGPSKSNKKDATAARPKSAFAAPKEVEEEETDHVVVLGREEKGEWSVVQNPNIVQAKNKDVVTFEMNNPVQRIIILRVQLNTSSVRAEKIASLLEKSMQQRVVSVVLRQRNDDTSDVMIQCAHVNRIDRHIRKLAEEGFEEGPPPSKDIILHEGQKLTVRFRGNIHNVDDESLSTCFNSHIKSQISFKVKETDKFAQKTIECFRGFAQVYMPVSVKKTVKKDDKTASQSEKGQATEEITVIEEKLLCEMLISLPKPEPEPPKPIPKAPIVIKSDGRTVDDAVLKDLASELGDEWKKIASILNIRSMRIQAILRNNVSKESEPAIYEMLLTWAKKVPRSMNKTEILCNALNECGRHDLEELLRDKELDVRRERARSSRDSCMRKAFTKVAQSPRVLDDIRKFGSVLGLNGSEIESITGSFEGLRQASFQMLVKWKEKRGEAADLKTLAKLLKRHKYHHAAEQAAMKT